MVKTVTFQADTVSRRAVTGGVVVTVVVMVNITAACICGVWQWPWWHACGGVQCRRGKLIVRSRVTGSASTDTAPKAKGPPLDQLLLLVRLLIFSFLLF